MGDFSGGYPLPNAVGTPPEFAHLLFAQVYWLYTRAEFNKTDFLTCLLITEVNHSVCTIEEHSKSELGHSE